MSKLTQLALAGALSVGFFSNASAVVIDFDSPIPAGVTVNYFDNVAGVLGALPTINIAALQFTPSAIPSSGDALLLNSTSDSSAPQNQGALFSFATAQNFISMVGNDFGGTDPEDNEQVFLTVFDVAGVVLGSTSVQGPYAQPNLQPISFAVSGIRYAAFTYTTDLGYYSVDNVTATPVPEPETYAMLLAGLGLLGAMKRRKKAPLAV